MLNFKMGLLIAVLLQFVPGTGCNDKNMNLCTASVCYTVVEQSNYNEPRYTHWIIYKEGAGTYLYSMQSHYDANFKNANPKDKVWFRTNKFPPDLTKKGKELGRIQFPRSFIQQIIDER